MSSATVPLTDTDLEATRTEGTAEIADAILTVSRAFTQSKAHLLLCRKAGVELDRSGSVLLYKLYAEGEDVHLGVLAERIGVDAPAVTRKVQQLEREGLLRRERDANDARALRIMLTEEGRADVELLLSARREWLDDALASWSADERLEFSRLLQRFATAISRDGGSDVS